MLAAVPAFLLLIALGGTDPRVREVSRVNSAVAPTPLPARGGTQTTGDVCLPASLNPLPGSSPTERAARNIDR